MLIPLTIYPAISNAVQLEAMRILGLSAGAILKPGVITITSVTTGASTTSIQFTVVAQTNTVLGRITNSWQEALTNGEATFPSVTRLYAYT